MGWGWNHQPDVGFLGETHGAQAKNPATHPAVNREDFMAFAVAYLPSELSSVLGVLLLGVGVVQVLVERFGW